MASQLSRRRFLTRAGATAGAALGGASFVKDVRPLRAEAAGADAPTTLTVMGYSNEVLPAYVKDFENHNPGVKITFLTLDQSRLTAMLNAGQPPDWIRFNSFDSPRLAALGLMLDLDPYFQTSKVLRPADLLAVNNEFRWDGQKQGIGRRYSMSHGWDPSDIQLWYNRKFFDQLGVKYPSATEALTYDELLALAKRVTVRKNGKVLVYGLDALWGWYTQAHLITMLAQVGKSLFNADFTQADFTSPEIRKVLQWYVDYAQARVGPSPLDPDPQWEGALWVANRVAMNTYGFWFEGQLKLTNAKLFESAGYAPVPLWGSKFLCSTVGAAGAWIPQSSQKKDLAWKFMEYYMGEKPARDRAASGWGLSALKSLLPLAPRQTANEKLVYDLNLDDLRHYFTLSFSPYISDSAMEAAIQQYINPVMLGKAKLDQACQQLEAAVNRLLKAGKQQTG